MINDPDAEAEAVKARTELGNEQEPPAPYKRDIIVIKKDGTLEQVPETHWAYDGLHFVVMFPNGDEGWHYNYHQKQKKKKTDELNDSQTQREQESKQKFVTAREFYAHRIQDRPGLKMRSFLFSIVFLSL
jgi:hypothetical protein